MIKKYFNINLILCSVVFLAACKRDNTPIGPAYKVPSANFEVLTPFMASADEVNFSVKETEYFTATFSEEVSWSLKLSGANSGAEKVISGYSKSLDVANTLWDGKHSGLYFFRSEQVIATLTFLGSKLMYTDTFNIVYPRKWDIPGKVITALNFESAPGSTKFAFQFYDGTSHKFPDYKSTDPTPSDMIDATNNRIEGVIRDINGDTIKSERVGSIEGDKLYRFAGTDGLFQGDGYSDYFIGGGGLAKSPFYALDSNAENVYFNIYVYGTGDKNSKLVINFAEDDDDANKTADQGNMAQNYVLLEDEYEFGIQVDWVGWKLVSGKYSNFPLTTAGASAPLGNKKREPHHIGKIGMVLLSSNKGNKASVVFDFATFTMGKPFNPLD
ncbi:MAG: hypothetical protein NT150_01570 [Bacteroidetes bacterium]|nr:hypothetical protein [Bacteroidota bacterium]